MRGEDGPPRPTHVLFVTDAEWLRVMGRVGRSPAVNPVEGDVVDRLLVAIEGELGLQVPKGIVFGVQAVDSPPQARFHLLE